MATALLADEDTDTSPYLLPTGGAQADKPPLPLGDEEDGGKDDNAVSFPVPGSDAEALAFIQRLKGVTDAHAAMPEYQHPDNQGDFAAARAQILDAGIDALHQYHDTAKTPFSATVLQAIRRSPEVDTARLPDVDHAEIAQLASQFQPGSLTLAATAAPRPSPAFAPLYPMADDSLPFPGAVDSLLRVPGAGGAAYTLDADTLEPVSGALLPDGTVNRAGILPTGGAGGAGGRFPVPGPADYSLPGGSLASYGLPTPGAATSPTAGSGYRPSQYMERGYFSTERDPQSGRFEFIHDDNAPTARLVPQEALTAPAKDLTAYQRQNLAIRQQREGRLAAPPVAKPLMDNWGRLSADLQALTGHSLADIQSAGAEDTHKEPGGIAYYLGGDDGEAKERVFLPQDQFDSYIKRFNAIKDGSPTQLNASTGTSAAAQPTARPAASQAPAAAPAAAGNASGADDQAAAWAAANLNDPRAVRIRQMLNLP